MTLFEKTALFERLSVFPALTLMVMTRSHIGFRLIHPVAVAVVTAGMWMISLMADSASMPRLLYYHAWAFAIMAGVHRIARWRDFRRGVKQHSYYLGTSVLDYRWLGFIHRHRLVARWLEPALWGVASIMLFQKGAKAEAIWIAFCAFCLRTFEEAVHRKQRDRDFDMVDGLVMSEVHSGTVEQFSAPVATAASAAPKGGAISTGLSPELKALMARRSKPTAVTEAVVPETKPMTAKSGRNGLKAVVMAVSIDVLQGVASYLVWHGGFLRIELLRPLLIGFSIVDAGAFVAAIWLLRFRWLLVPAVLLELIPVINLLPLWTIFVGVVAWKGRDRKPKSAAAPPPVTVATPEHVLQVVIHPNAPISQELPLVIAVPAPSQADAPGSGTSYSAEAPPIIIPQPAKASAEPDPSTSLFLSREGLVIAVLVIPTILLVFWLLHSLHRPEKTPQLASGTEQVSRVMTRSAERRIRNAKRHYDNVVERFEAVVKPGPEPDSFWHPIDHGVWEAYTRTYAGISATYRRDLEEAQRTRDEAEDELKNLATDLSGVSERPALVSEAKSLWASYILPPLHFLLAFSLFRFSARAIFRFLLLKDQIGAIRL